MAYIVVGCRAMRASICSGWVRALCVASLFSLLGACAAQGEEESEAGVDGVAALSAPTPRTMCFGGRTFGDPYSIGGIRELDDLCLRMPGLIRDVPDGRDAPYAFFQWSSSVDHVLDVLVGALDTDHDGAVTTSDAPVDLTLVGYSWGGFNALDLAAKMANDPRLVGARKQVRRLFVLDAFRTDYLVLPRGELRVPENVRTLYSFRHTSAPEVECSSLLFGTIGPFTGRDPLCHRTTECFDYDFSLAPSTANVDHCDVPRYATPFVLELDQGRPPANLPPSRPVRRY